MITDTKCRIHKAAEQARKTQSPKPLVNKGMLDSRTEECKSCNLCKTAIWAIEQFAIAGNPRVFDRLLDGGD